MNNLRVAYGGMAADHSAPGDRRRFSGFARRHGIELVNPQHVNVKCDATFLTLGTDISRWKELRRRNSTLILDVVDSYTDEAPSSPARIFRGSYKSLTREFSRPHLRYVSLLKEIMRGADAVVCASLEQKIKFQEFNSNVHAIVDCFDEVLDNQFASRLTTGSNTVLWEGFPRNLAHFKVMNVQSNDFLFSIVTAEKMQQRLSISRPLLTRDYLKKLNIVGEVVPWTIPNLRTAAANCGFAVIPIDSRDKMAWSKSENKLLGLWALGVPVLTSPTPSYSRTAKAAGLEECLVNDSDWTESLTKMIKDPNRANEVALIGKAFALEHVRSAAVDANWRNLFTSVGLDFRKF